MPTGKGSQSIRSAKALQPNFELSFRRSNGLLKLHPRTLPEVQALCADVYDVYKSKALDGNAGWMAYKG